MKPKIFALGLFSTMFSLLIMCAIIIVTERTVASGVDEEPYYSLMDSDRYTLVHEFSLKNGGTETAYNINVRVALMDKDTPLYTNLLREQLIPWPDSIVIDEFGRRVALYHFEEIAIGKEIVFIQKFVLDCGWIKYPKLEVVIDSGYEEQLAAQYLLPSKGIESDNEEIIAFAQQVTQNQSDVYGMAKAAFAAVNQHMTYVEDNSLSPDDRGALRALRRAYGVCEDYSKLYVAVLRSLGIAARQQSGYLYLLDEHSKPPYLDEESRLDLSLLRHAWAEFYLPGKGWVIVDPTFTYSFEFNGVVSKFPNWDYFASITKDRRYVFFREESLNDDETFKFQTRGKGGASLQYFGSYYLEQGSHTAFFNDLDGHWAMEAIMSLADREEPLLKGMGNGMFGVNDLMTRAQLVTCLQRIKKSPPAGPKFVDLSTTHWAYRDIGAAQQGGWISGYPGDTFRPDNPISRAELAELMVNAFELTYIPPELEDTEESLENEDVEQLEVDIAEEEIPNAFFEELREEPIVSEEDISPAEDSVTDEDFSPDEDSVTEDSFIIYEDTVEITEYDTPLGLPPVFQDLGQPGLAWADSAITTLYLLGFVQGTGNGYYQPERYVTRAEFATVLFNIVEAQNREIMDEGEIPE
ncbi:MAG: S-layer homology domain-containing protein [Clostridiales bacterium]|nr:S-layer homology domain-containing protein [Clostridiales bacterium]